MHRRPVLEASQVTRIGSSRHAAATAAILLAIAVASPGSPAQHRDEPRAAAPGGGKTPNAHIARGRAIYDSHCYFCHGYAGDARTSAAEVLDPPPRDFTSASPLRLSRPRMIAAVRDGRPGTAMQAYGSRITGGDVEAAVDYVRQAFMGPGAVSARYHSPANGWADDPRDSPAASFATGEVPLATAWEALSPRLQEGKRQFLAACVSCHANADHRGESPWRPESVSYPPGNYLDHVPAVTERSLESRHESPPALPSADPVLRLGETLYQDHCAHCHAADGTGRNWVGAFLDPPPPDFTRPSVLGSMTREEIVRVIRGGRAGTAMSAWQSVLSDEQIEALARYLGAAFHPVRE